MECRFELGTNFIKITDDPYTEIELAILHNALHAVFVTSQFMSPDSGDEYLRLKVPAWPPFYRSMGDFSLLFDLGTSGEG